jgi:hypothetical protein
LYREHAERRQFREHALSLKEFVTGLQLRVEVAEATDDRLGRVSQLTFRTNQFNVTSIRRSEEELRRFISRAHATCLVVRVVDRFGDYGLVGAVMYETTADCYKVDTFLLSCRVLGRGVEHAVLSQLGQRAVREEKRWIELTYLPTNKNVPAFEFLASIGNQYRNEAGTSWTFPAERLARLRYDPDEQVSAGDGITAPVETAHQSQPASRFGALDRPERLQRIGEFLYDVGRISKSIDEHRLARQPLTAVPDFTPGSTLETVLTTIWRTVLGRPRIGLHDNFFEVGGTSLKAVQVVAAIRKQLKQSLSIVGLFECPTVALLAARLQSASAETPPQTVATDAALRGQQRRYTPMRRRVC